MAFARARWLWFQTTACARMAAAAATGAAVTPAIAAAGSGRVADAYVIDDGVGENSVGVQGSGHMGWINQFEVAPGLGEVTEVSVAFGPVQAGVPFKVYVWSDPNQDGDPTDAKVLTGGAGMTANVNSDVFNVIDVPDKQLGNVGERFFVGVFIEAPAQQFPARIDLSTQRGLSWFIGGGATGIDPDDIGSAEFITRMTNVPGLNGNWMVRAGAVPAPGAGAVLLVGLAGAACIRRRG